MRLIRSSEYQRMPWKNGGGETVQIVVDSGARSLDDFIWRISMAHVAVDGPFSLFPGVDRTLCVLEGQGISLAIVGRAPMNLDRDCLPQAFPADVLVHATLESGPITDLNVMTRRGRAHHFVTRMTIDAPATIAPLGDVALLLLSGECLLEQSAQSLMADAGDSVLLEQAAGSIQVSPVRDMVIHVVDIWISRG